MFHCFLRKKLLVGIISIYIFFYSLKVKGCSGDLKHTKQKKDGLAMLGL